MVSKEQIFKVLEEYFKEPKREVKFYTGWMGKNIERLIWWETLNEFIKEYPKNNLVEDETPIFEVSWDFDNKDLNKIFSNKYLLPCLDFEEEIEFFKNSIREPLLDNYFNLLCLKPEKWMFKKNRLV